MELKKELHIQKAHYCMEHHIYQVVAHGVQPMQQVVQPKGSHTEPVQLLAVLVTDVSAPEVVPKEVRPGGVWSRSWLSLRAVFIIQAQATVQTVQVNCNSQHSAEQRCRPHLGCSAATFYIIVPCSSPT